MPAPVALDAYPEPKAVTTAVPPVIVLPILSIVTLMPVMLGVRAVVDPSTILIIP